VGLASLHLTFFSRHRTHALPFTGTGGGDGSLICVFFRADGDDVSSSVFVFFAADLQPVSGEFTDAFILRLLFVFNASGKVDISIS
jgi:hypothetical protein